MRKILHTVIKEDLKDEYNRKSMIEYDRIEYNSCSRWIHTIPLTFLLLK